MGSEVKKKVKKNTNRKILVQFVIKTRHSVNVCNDVVYWCMYIIALQVLHKKNCHFEVFLPNESKIVCSL